jgi:uncharacterized protein (DUF302 family)
MKPGKTITIAALSLFSASLFAAQGLIRVASPYSVEDTAKRFEQVISAKGMKIFQRIRHSDAAAAVGVPLKPTQLIIFGNPKVGSPLMKCAPTVAIDLPQKALVWQDADGKVWIGYNDPEWLKQRHDIQGCDQVLDKVSGALAKLTAAAVR